jgi:hypothetical protein
MMGKMVPILARAMKDKEFEYNFLTICRYLNLVKNKNRFTFKTFLLVYFFRLYSIYDQWLTDKVIFRVDYFGIG